jgi:hypothetical protein
MKRWQDLYRTELPYTSLHAIYDNNALSEITTLLDQLSSFEDRMQLQSAIDLHPAWVTEAERALEAMKEGFGQSELAALDEANQGLLGQSEVARAIAGVNLGHGSAELVRALEQINLGQSELARAIAEANQGLQGLGQSEVERLGTHGQAIAEYLTGTFVGYELAGEVLDSLDWNSVSHTAFGLGATELAVLETTSDRLREAYSDLWDAYTDEPAALLTLPPILSRRPPAEAVRHTQAIEAFEDESGGTEEDEASIKPQAAEKKTPLRDQLTELDPTLVTLWDGATSGFASDNPDRDRHILASLSALVTRTLHQMAPDHAIIKWTSDACLYRNRHPTRKARLLYVCREIDNGLFCDFLRVDVTSAIKLLELFDRGTNELRPSISTRQLRALLTRVEGLLLFLLATNHANVSRPPTQRHLSATATSPAMREVNKVICLIKGVSKDDAPVLLNYLSPDWNMSLFINLTLPTKEEDDHASIKTKVSERLGVSADSLQVIFDRHDESAKTVTEKDTADKEKAAKYGPKARYTFYYAAIAIDPTPSFLLRSRFQRRGVSYVWQTLQKLKSDATIRKHNYDVLEHLSARYDQTLVHLTLSFRERIETTCARGRVFLAHGKEDKAVVRDLYQKLRFDDFNPWLDEEDLLGGQDWELEIKKAIRGSNAVLICLSSSSTTRKGFLHKEIKLALDVAEEQPEGVIFVIPVQLEDCEVPERLKKYQWVKLYQEGGYEKLLRALRFSKGSNVQ